MKSFFSCVCSGTLVAEYCKCGKDSDKFARTSQEQSNCVVSTKASSMTKLSKDMEYKAFFNLTTAIQFLPLSVTWGNPKWCLLEILPSGDNEKLDMSLTSLMQKLQQYWVKIFPALAKETAGFVISGFWGQIPAVQVQPVPCTQTWQVKRSWIRATPAVPSSSGITLAYRWIHALRGLKVTYNLYYSIHFNSKELASW